MPFLHNQTCEKNSRANWLKQITEGTGYRSSIHAPDAGKYTGFVKNAMRHGHGIKIDKYGSVYIGGWKKNLHHGFGVVEKRNPNGNLRAFVKSHWKHHMKDGKGEKLYTTGNYYGTWRENERSGLGVMWYYNGNMFIGEWLNDKFDGRGSMLYANYNRYEGLWKNGLKHGKGKFFHKRTGQLQTGEWEDDVCVRSIMEDSFRTTVKYPTECSVTIVSTPIEGNLVFALLLNDTNRSRTEYVARSRKFHLVYVGNVI